MVKSVVLAIVLNFVVLTTGSVLHARQDGGLPELEPPALEAFLVPFRQAVLHRVAVAWNHTITDSAKLEADMQTCSNQIKSTVEQCKTCATNACTKTQHVVNSSPAFTDYLLLATQLLNPLEFLKGPLNEIGDKFGDIVDLLGSGGASFIDSMSSLGNDIGGAFTDVFHGLEQSFNAVKDALQKAIDGITDVGNSIGNGLTDAGNTVIDGIGGIFGRKRRETISPELKACMTPCGTCQPLLKNHSEMIVSVCGEEVVKFNETVRHNVISIKGIFTAVSDKTHQVITKIEIDPTSLSGVSYTKIYITGNIKGNYVRYQSKVIYDMMNLGSTANNIAEEFWNLWM